MDLFPVRCSTNCSTISTRHVHQVHSLSEQSLIVILKVTIQNYLISSSLQKCHCEHLIECNSTLFGSLYVPLMIACNTCTAANAAFVMSFEFVTIKGEVAVTFDFSVLWSSFSIAFRMSSTFLVIKSFVALVAYLRYSTVARETGTEQLFTFLIAACTSTCLEKSIQQLYESSSP